MSYQAIGIAGDPGAGKSELIKRLLAHPFFASWTSCSTGDLLRQRHAKLSSEGLYKGTFADYLAKGLTDEEIIALNADAHELVKKGNCLLDSRYAVKNCQNVSALLVFLTASLNVRVERRAKGDTHKHAEIHADLIKRANWEFETGMRLFHYDYRDKSNYHLVLNTGALTIDEEVEKIVEKLSNSKLILAISGLPGAGSTTTARLIASKLNLEYFSPGRIFKDIGRGVVKNQSYYPLFKELCDKEGIVIPEASSSNDTHATVNLWETPFGKSEKTHQIIDEVQRRYARTGNIILDGKLSINMLPEARLKIWLTAPLDARIPRVAQRDSILEAEAHSLLTEREEHERRTWKEMYGFDYLSQAIDADLVIDTSNLPPEGVAEKILTRLHAKL